ncbi:MAG: type IX secretion system sortase PorU [Candidatus Krumholzibacteriales bacterium]
MKRLMIIILVFAVSTPALSSEPQVRIIDSDGRGMVVEVTSPPYRRIPGPGGPASGGEIIEVPGYELIMEEDRPVLPRRRHLFSVGSVSEIKVEVIETETEIIEGAKPAIFHYGFEINQNLWEGAGILPEKDNSFVFLRKAGLYRKKPLALVEVRPVIFNEETGRMTFASRILFRISHSFSEPERGAGLPGFILGAGDESPVSISRPEARHSDFQFGESDQWVRLEVPETGIYRVDYDALHDNGINLMGIDPSGIRIFSGGHFSQNTNLFQQPESVVDGGSFKQDYSMSEHAIRLVGMEDGTFDPGNYILFFGVGVEGWTDYLEPEAESHERYDNLYEKNNVYWLSLGGNFAGEPARMESLDTAPSGSSPENTIDSYIERLHLEEDREYFPLISDDRWVWDFLVSGGNKSTRKEFSVHDIVSSGCRIRTIGFGGKDSVTDLARCYLNDVLVGEMAWIGSDGSFNPDTLDVNVSSLRESSNYFEYRKTDSGMEMNIYWYQVFYERYLRPDPDSGDLDFSAPGAGGSTRFILTEFFGEDPFIFDVTDYYNPVLLEGAYSSNDSVIFDYGLGTSSGHFMAVTPSGIKEPGIENSGSIPSLRDEQAPSSMVVIYHGAFEEAALEYVAHRSGNNSPGVIRAVDIDDVYNNFSGGLKDPLAIRNYLKYLYDNYSEGGEPAIEYALLMGKGTFDPKDIKGAGKDFIPFFYRTVGGFNVFVEYDDFLARLDDTGDDFVDIAMGRLPFQNSQGAGNYMDKLRGYEAEDNNGAWKNKLIFVADDEHQGDSHTQFEHMQQTERMSSNAIKRDHFDISEVYLHEYPFDGSTKPEAAAALAEEWNEGGLLVCYFGHGSPYQLADELVLKKSDIYSLNNGNRLPLFLPLSCSVGDQEKLYDTSLSEDLILAEGRGAIASIAAVTITLPTWNEDMCRLFLLRLWPEGTLDSETVGKALSYAKINSLTAYPYILSGDPSMKMAMPELNVRHDYSTIDTLVTGFRYSERGSVMVDGSLDPGFNGTAEIIVREAEKRFEVNNYDYNHEGAVMYRGTSEITGGIFDFQFVVPLRCRIGDRARLRSYVYSDDYRDGVGACDTLRIIQNSTPPANDGPPRVSMYFNNMATRVKKGSRLFVDIADDNGIAILGKDPQNSILLEFDDSGYPIQVTDYFQYDHNSYTSGGLEYSLNEDFDIGDHSVLLRVFDNLGEMSTDTLNFSIVEEGVHKISDAFNFPNPLSESTNFVFQLTSPAKVKFAIYNLSGKKIWERRISAVEGYNSIYWDGTDYANNTVANGTYIYLIDAKFPGTLGRNEKVKGKVVVLK